MGGVGKEVWRSGAMSMTEVISEYETGRKNLRTLADWYAAHPGDRNEATTRLQIVDRLFFECLGWTNEERVELEHEHNQEYADYVFTTDRNMLILEAKREGDDFELPVGKTRLRYSIKALMADYPGLKKAIEQVAGYCYLRGVPYAVICNGHQAVSFVAVRTDSVPPLEGKALVFPSLEYMASNFLDLWQTMSRPGVEANKLHHYLVSDASPDLPAKLSASLSNYPGVKGRNIFQTDMKILTELVIEDVSRSPELEDEFLMACYCESNALSQYSQLSRDILSARYSALFDASAPAPALIPVKTVRGITPDLLAESLSRRPIILIGDVGVGKTMFQRNLIVKDTENIFKNSICFYVDFGSQATLSTDLKSFFINELERQLLINHNTDIHEKNFIIGVYDLDLKRFEKGLFGSLASSNPGAFAESLSHMYGQAASRYANSASLPDGSSRFSINWIIASLMNDSDDRTLFSRSLLRRRHRPSQAKVRSTVHRIGSFTHPSEPSGRRMILRSHRAFAATHS